MSASQLLRRATTRPQPRLFRPGPFRRRYTTPPPEPTKPPSEATPPSAIRRFVARLPRPLRPYVVRLESAPLSHAAAFLILHELTAIVPLLALFALFHYTDLHVAPVAWVAERYGPYVEEGLAKFERYFRRKGWFGLDKAAAGDGEQDSTTDALTKVQAAQGPYRVVVEVALAYAITKAMLPLRIAGSLWATPWFAGVIVRAKSLFRKR
ncbi:hypothetical protein PpBr36_05552 [Pyricularia pennisetigena]|uniref:hypothetical protein n=1 Tax=Pyricularia pennisetigena TaxID=1578925 RepID=UPI00115171F0|nr:hypothetical protein PpBr36_05552 [Pyricularia pennisetigena]TLS26350.1 hypothetical protein PpBr36_05552 [Pyricularia pennisetigena]